MNIDLYDWFLIQLHADTVIVISCLYATCSMLLMFVFISLDRYRIYEYNVDDLLLCSLPHHDTESFVRILQMVSLSSETSKWHWLEPCAVSNHRMMSVIVCWLCYITDFLLVLGSANLGSLIFRFPTTGWHFSQIIVNFGMIEGATCRDFPTEITKMPKCRNCKNILEFATFGSQANLFRWLSGTIQVC